MNAQTRSPLPPSPPPNKPAALSAMAIARRVSTALAATAAVVAILSFSFWELFHRDVPMGIGNMRGTALSMLLLALPTMIAAMRLAGRGSLRGEIVWLGCLAYLAYNSVMFCFAAHFNSLFLLFTSLLALVFWALITLFRALDLEAIQEATRAVPARLVAVYLLLCVASFALLWLQSIVPATVVNSSPAELEQTGLAQNPVWVLDFAFTFPLAVVGSVWLWRRRAWGFIIAGMMTIMLTIETAGIAIDQVFGHMHDPTASLDAVPAMIVFTAAGLFFSTIFLRGVRRPAE